MEVNASDTRNKADKSAKAGMGGKLSNAIKELANNTALGVAQDGRRKRVRCCSNTSHAPFCLTPLCMRSLTNIGARLTHQARNPTQLVRSVQVLRDGAAVGHYDVLRCCCDADVPDHG